MGQVAFIWDLDNDRDGNYWHICVEGHGVSRDEVEEVVTSNYETATWSRSSGQPEAFGWTDSGKYITVVFGWYAMIPSPFTPLLPMRSRHPDREKGGRDNERR